MEDGDEKDDDHSCVEADSDGYSDDNDDSDNNGEDDSYGDIDGNDDGCYGFSSGRGKCFFQNYKLVLQGVFS